MLTKKNLCSAIKVGKTLSGIQDCKYVLYYFTVPPGQVAIKREEKITRTRTKKEKQMHLMTSRSTFLEFHNGTIYNIFQKYKYS